MNNKRFEQWYAKVEKELKGATFKKYLHLDRPRRFMGKKEEVRKLLLPKNVARHSFLPLLRINTRTPRYKRGLAPKPSGKKRYLKTKVRPIAYSSHKDSIIYAYYSHVLNEQYDRYLAGKGYGEAILAYRNDPEKKCNIQHAKEAFEYIKDTGPCTVIALDVSGYFDNIDHEILKEKWMKLLGEKEGLSEAHYNVYKSITRYSFVYRQNLLRHFKFDLKTFTNKVSGEVREERLVTLLDFLDDSWPFSKKMDYMREHDLIHQNPDRETAKGIPQGTPISAVLSNIYLIDFDEKFEKKANKEGFLYRRYCDDILIACPTDKAEEILELISHEITQHHKLDVQPEKADIVRFAINKHGQLRGFNAKRLEKNFGSEEKAAGLTAVYTGEIPKEDQSKYYSDLQYLGFEFNGQTIYIRSSSLARYYRKLIGRINKSVNMAYGANNGKDDRIYRRQLFHKYTHLGKRNFITYALKASKPYYEEGGIQKQGMDSPAIRKQVARHMRHAMIIFENYNQRRYQKKFKKGKAFYKKTTKKVGPYDE